MLSDLILLPKYLLLATGTLLRDWRLIGYCLVPTVIGAVTFISLISSAWTFRADLVAMVVSSPEGVWGWVLSVMGMLLAVLAAGVLALFAGMALGAVCIDEYVDLLLHHYQIKTSEKLTFQVYLQRTWRGILESCKRLLVVGGLGVILTISSFLPILSLPILVASAFLAGSDILNTPLSLLNIPFRERWQLSVAQFSWCVASGTVLIIFMLVPLGGFLIYPLLLGASVQRLRDLKQQGQLSTSAA